MIARRGQFVRQAVLEAALIELTESGYAAFTIENVATRAHVHKTTVYRRWTDRESLVTDAVLEHAADDFDIHDSGSIDADLSRGTRDLAAWLSGPVGTPLVAMLKSDGSRLPAVVEAKTRFFTSRAETMRKRLDAAMSRDQLPAGIDPLAFLATLVAPLYLDLLVLDRSPTPEDCDRTAQIALTAARAGLLGSEATRAR